MPRRVLRAAALLVACSSALAANPPSPSVGQAADPSVRLEPGRAIERTIAGGAEHRYELALKPGEHATIAVAQVGVDVDVRVFAPDGTLVGRFDDEARPGRDERAEVVANTGGIHTVRIATAYKLASSGAYVIRGVERRDATPEDRARQDVRKLRADYGPFYYRRAAQPIIERALALAESTLGPDSIEVAALRRDLAHVRQLARDYAAAVPVFEQSAAAFERILGPDHPETASVWTSLGASYAGLGQRPKAEPLLQRALAVTEQALGRDHPQVALCLIGLANVRMDAGDLDAAEPQLRRALAIVERTRGPDTQMSAVLNNLGTVYTGKEQFDQADESLRRSLAIQEQLGQDDVQIAITLQNLGVIARQRKDLGQAEEYYVKALALRRKTLGPDHPDIAMNLNNLANLYRAQGDVARSLETHFQALSLFEKNAGPYNVSTVTSLGNIARTYASMGDVANAIEFQRRVDTALETQLAFNLVIGSERQKLAFAGSVADRTERTISLSVDTRFAPAATELAALAVLQRKGRVLDAMTDAFASIRRHLASDADRQLLEQLSATTTELARLALGDPQQGGAADRLAALARLEQERERLEAALSERNAEFRARATPVTLDAVRAAIPADAALLEFAVYRPFDPKADSNSTAYGTPRYVAYAMTRRDTRGADLGPARAIDEAVAALRQALGDPDRADVAALARQVDAVVMQPIRSLIEPERRLLVSPDGALNLLPFEALPDEQGRLALERHEINYVSSGRDLLRMQVARPNRSEAVVVANPAFGDPAAEAARPIASGQPQAGTRSLTSVDDLAKAYFAPLGGTALEAQRIKALLPEATVLAREQATKQAILQLQAPRVLHIATHGFFIQDAQRRIPNPLLRSGLALSGANLRAGSGGQGGAAANEGILTALEASNLDLWGTRLVTLSACDTGIGDVRNGEGVYGLRRAFQLAGAETLVMSLWPVSDYVTREMMTDYYTGLTRGLGRGEALRQAKLAMLARKGRRHPFYWASFIQAGDWAPLDARR